MPLIKRLVKGSPLTFAEGDANLDYLENLATSSIFTSSLLEYYVDRRFTGGCEVTILADKTISSSNAAYLVQLSASRIGDPNHPWPDPWSANLRASSSIASGQSTNARIIVKTGNTYTYGSSVLAQNGDLTGSLTNNLQPDVAVSQSNYNLRAFDLITPNVEYYFEPESSLYNINKTWQQMLTYYTSSDWTIAPEFKITGKGKFVNVYGQGQGFICKFGIIQAPRAEITLEADHIVMNMWQGWDLSGQKTNINVDKWWSQSSYILVLGSLTDNWPTQSILYPSYSLGIPIYNVNINDYRWGDNLFGDIAPPASDYWGGIGMTGPFPTQYNIDINTFVFNVKRATDGAFRVISMTTATYPTASNTQININIGYISGSHRSVGGGLFNFFSYNNNRFFNNMMINMNVKKFDAWGMGFGSSFSPGQMSNSTFKFHCDDYRNYARSFGYGGACLRMELGFQYTSSIGPAGTGYGVNNQTIFSGNYINYANDERLISFAIGSAGNTNNTIQNTLILDNFRGYNFGTGSIYNSCVEIANSTFHWNSSGSYVVIKDSILYASASNIIHNTGNNTGSVIIDSTKMNRDAIGSRINIQGSYDVSSDLFYIMS